MKDILKAINDEENFLILDGGMGTMLLASGLDANKRPESFNLTNPDIIKDIHTKYLQAGSRVIYTNTFGANAGKFKGTDLDTRQVVTAAVEIAKSAVSSYPDAYVALDVGPSGLLIEPTGDVEFEKAYEIFKEVCLAGSAAGADLIVIETMTDLAEMRAALIAAKENTDLPVICTMSFEENGRTFTGTSVEIMALTLSGLGADAIGINCSLGPSQILPIAKRLVAVSSVPVAIKANAGLPDPMSGGYDILPQDFGPLMAEFAHIGIHILGGCCGTTPEYIKEMIKCSTDRLIAPCEVSGELTVCSASTLVKADKVRVIGERINPTGKKKFQAALKEGDMDEVASRAIEQVEGGAEILDINVGVPGIDEVAMMQQVVRCVQGICSLPLQIDSTNPRAIEAGLRIYCGKAIVNSVNGEDESLDSILPIVKKYGASVIGLCLDENGIPPTAEGRIKIAKKILKRALSYGIKREDVIIDCLTLTVSAEQSQAVETLNAVRYVTEKMHLKTTLGVSNISFGLPQRVHATESFLTQAMFAGLTLPIINPNQTFIMDAIASYRIISGDDVGGDAYIERFSQKEADVKAASQEQMSSDQLLTHAVLKGLLSEATDATLSLLKFSKPMDIIDNVLIPALDKVGMDFEKQITFLPQLLKSAKAATASFEVIKKYMKENDEGSAIKGKVILATVQGDIHDIGKNIVKVMLENYGYQVIDLGKDVPPEKIADTAKEQGIRVIGLSALMTTTLESMRKTIELLRSRNIDCKVIVGGAVLTEEYAMDIGADYYSKDAKQTVDITKEILG